MAEKKGKKEEKEISYTDTKADIWNAYKEVLERLESRESTPKKSETALRKVAKTHKELKAVLDEARGKVVEQLDISFAEIVDKFTRAEEQLQELQIAIEKQRKEIARQKEEELKEFAEEKERLRKERERKEEEYEYDFAKRKKRQEEELSEKREKVEAELEEHKRQMQESREEISSLRKKVEMFDKRVADEVEKATKELEEKLRVDYEHEKALREQKHESELALQKQKIVSLEAQVKSQELEIKRLQSELADASKQVTRIAERAVSPKDVSPEREDPDKKENYDRRNRRETS